MTNTVLRGKPDAGNPHVRFDEGEVASAKPRRGSLLYKSLFRFVYPMGVALVAASSGAATLRVDPSDSTAYATIQAAVDAASAGDTVRVAPGTYETGWKVGPTSGSVEQKCRVVVDKRLTFVSEGSRDDTFIVGSYADLAEPKESADAVSCVYLTEEAAGTTFRGFTFRDGALRNAFSGGGGIAYGNCDVTPAAAYTNVLCRFEHCTATKGGALAGGTTVATLFVGNWVSGANAKGSSTYSASVYNCVFVHDSEDDVAAYATPISNPICCVNCTVVNCFKTFGMEQGNWSSSGTQGHMYNFACFQNLWTSGNQYIYDTAVVEGEKADQPNYNTEKSTGTIVAVPLNVNWADQRQKLLMAPMLGDFRPVKNGTLDGIGARDHLALIPEAYRNMDFNGNAWDSTTASVPVGAILSAAEPVANPLCVSVPPKMTVDGHAIARNDNIFLLWGSNTPRSVVFKAFPDVNLFGYKIKQYGSTIYRAPDPDGRFVVTLGAEYNENVRQTGYGRLDAQTYGKVYYVDEKNGNDDNAGTTSDAAFATLRKAAEAVATLADQTYVVVNVAPGVYSNGYVTSTVSDRRVRFAAPAGRHVWLRGMGGADVTVIEGAADPDALAENEGCGANAVAGVDSPNSSFVSISGFTFRNCRSNLSAGGSLGGAVRLGNQNENVTDCVFSNNVAYGIGAALYAGAAHRCRFSDNLSLAADTKCVAYSVRADTCIFENLRDMDAVHNSYLYNCTLCGCGTSKTTVLIPSDTHAYNCIGVGGGTIAGLWNAANMKGCVYWGLNTVSPATGWIKANPLLASAERGDYRPLAGSPVFTSGAIDITNDPVWRYTTTDIAGNPLYVTGAERIVGVDSVPRTARHHYVATDGNDAADGLTPATAKRTLMAAMTDTALMAGDTVEAAPGTYADGSAVHVGAACDYVSPMPTPSLPSRVIVPADVSLVSRDGAAATVIQGGANVRCAFLEAGARLDGFTLTGGSLPFDATDSDDGSAAAVLGRKFDTSVVANCLVTGCSSWCAPAGSEVTFDHCVISNNLTRGRELLRHTSHYNCLIDGNRCSYTIYAFGSVVNTTVGTNNCYYLGGTVQALVTPMDDNLSMVVNSLFLQETTPKVLDMRNIPVKNCIFTEPTFFSGSANFENVVTNLSRAAATELYDVSGRPLVKTAPSVDAGRSDAPVGVTDVAGGSRVLNGTVDIGAFEYDWRTDYLTDLGAPRHVKIGDVSSTVIEANGKVILSAGDALELTFSGKTGEYLLTASVSGGGVLGVYCNGIRIGALSAAGTFLLPVTGASDVIHLMNESADGAVALESFKSNRGLMLILR